MPFSTTPNLQNASLQNTSLVDADLDTAALINDSLDGADLTDASLFRAYFTEVGLVNANLTGSDYGDAIDIYNDTFGNTTCLYGTNSDNDAGTCLDDLGLSGAPGQGGAGRLTPEEVPGEGRGTGGQTSARRRNSRTL